MSNNQYYLIRHGQDRDNFEGILNGHRNQSLTKTGINQAIELANKIKEKNISIDVVLSSSLKRAYETAKTVSNINDFPKAQIENLLIERDFGIMTGKKITDIAKLCSPNIIIADKITYFLDPDGAETFPDLMSRAGNLLDKLNIAYQNKNILLVTHGDFGKMFFAFYYHLDWKEVLTSFHFGNSEMLILSPKYSPKNAKLISINQYNA